MRDPPDRGADQQTDAEGGADGRQRVLLHTTGGIVFQIAKFFRSAFRGTTRRVQAFFDCLDFSSEHDVLLTVTDRALARLLRMG